MSALILADRIPPPQADRRQTLIGQSREGLAARLEQLGVPERQSRMRVAQLWIGSRVKPQKNESGVLAVYSA